MKPSTLTAALLLVAAPATAGGIVVFEGQPLTSGNVLVVDPASGSSHIPLGLDGVFLLPLEVAGRTELERFLPGKAWLETDVPGASRAVLPQRRGSVYHFRRDVFGEGALFGYFVIDEQGDAYIAHEQLGTGPTFDTDPFLPRVAIAPDASALLAMTHVEAGGDLVEIPLGSGGFAIVRTNLLPPQDFLNRSPALSHTWGMAVSRLGVLRFPRTGGGDATFMTYSGAPAPVWFSGDVVLSSNGLFAATIASDTPPLGHVWAFGPVGSALRASETGRLLSGAGHLPGALHGPYLAISDDGSAVAWRSEGPTREAFLARVQLVGAPPPQQISSDTYFLDTLDEVGQYAFKPGSVELNLAVGSLSSTAPFTIESTDVFTVSLDPGGAPVFENVTQTNGLAQPPYLVAPTLKPLQASWTPAGDAILFHNEASGGGGELAALRLGQTGVQTLLPDVKEVFRVDRTNGGFVVVLRRAMGNKDLQLHLVPDALATTTSFFTAPDTDLFPVRAVRNDGVYVFVHRRPTFESMYAYDPVGGVLALMTPRPLRYGPTLGVGPLDDVGFGLGLVDKPHISGSWKYPDLPKRLLTVPAPGFVLPGV